MGHPSKPAEPAWLGQLGNVVKSNAKQGAKPDPKSVCQIGDVPLEPRQWCAFEFADQMEQGLAQGLTTSFIEPREDSSLEDRLIVQRSTNHKEYVLSSLNSEPLLLAVSSPAGDRFDIFTVSAERPDPSKLGPAFTLQAQGKELKQWTLHSERCERCEVRGKRICGRRELACFSHYSEDVADGKGLALCMDVDLPTPGQQDGHGSAVWCSVCGDEQEEMDSAVSLTTRRPQWNPRHRTLTLDFRGRCSLASSKNFQLVASSDTRRAGNLDVNLLYGKDGDNRFVLDHKRPLGTVQAFAAALTVSHWK